MIKKIILVLLSIVTLVVLIATAKFNLSDSDIYAEDANGNMVQIDTIKDGEKDEK